MILDEVPVGRFRPGRRVVSWAGRFSLESASHFYPSIRDRIPGCLFLAGIFGFSGV
jgi:hypothetical protein